MELLRIVAMLLIMAVHANFRALGFPSSTDVEVAPLSSLARFLSEGFCIMGVNVFVMISGWYGIKMKPIRLLELVFQIVFFVVLITCAICIIEDRNPNFSDLGHLLLKGNYDYWFIKAYLMMYIFSPVMNSFVESTDKKSFALVILLFFSFEFLYGWFFDGAVWFKHGYSGLSFIGLYLMARYLRIYYGGIGDKLSCFAIYVILALVIGFSGFFLTKNGSQNITHKMFYYTSPLVIFQATVFLLLFTKISLKSRFVNWVAISTLAVYLLHSNAYWGKTYYDNLISDWYSTKTTFPFIIHVGVLIIITFWCSIFLDKIRLLLWRLIKNKIGILLCNH